MDTSRLQYLLDKYLSEDILDAERVELFGLINDPSKEEELARTVDLQLLQRSFEIELGEETKAAIWQNVEPALITPGAFTNRVAAPSYRLHFLRRWGWAAAVLVIGTTIGIAVFYGKQSNTLKKDAIAATADIAPGSNKAVLTLSNGQRVELDSAAATTINDGKLAIQNKNGGLVYTSGEEVVMNTMNTPNGGQYQLTLADGTKVWLNAASSITYPTDFNGGNRKVKITGEVYLEVAKDKAHPFIVDVAGQSSVEVLGTSFNINSYGDEGETKTTLVEGSVRVGMNNDASAKSRVVLKSGEQAVTTESVNKPQGITVNTGVDISQTLAWKNGLFNFNGLSVHEVLNQLARWYDIKIQYQGREPDFHFMGKMYRSANLSEVLKMLQKMDVKFRMEGKTLIVL
jgi:ferric-dicitrate binding protein FerR (iron transport regulator)